ncbi:shikimate dehydrogenase [Bacillus sp. FJAT-27225]|uniref:shikimate dehydrogenase n=1 Tax=Bacillus sp. FJAT-27225 TaxID=1743144 RepID=UPI000AEE1322|nr:shikimate dehydrogenase [Bacillus sp. FJAT-27225]
MKLYGVIGNPIAQSKSPIMHNDLFGYYGIEAYYQPFLIEKGELAKAVDGIRALGIAGFNVTVPFKSEIIPLLDYIDPLAKEIGAVNTVINEGGKLTGYNTDGTGFLKSLEDEGFSTKGADVLVIGAGGAARAISFAIAQTKPKRIDFCNRSTENATRLAEEIAAHVPSSPLTLREAEREINKYGVVIQTTPSGMFPKDKEMPLHLENLKTPLVVADIIYNPMETRFLETARKSGALTINGLGMFIHQGALAFDIWTGIRPDTERMRNLLVNQLGGKRNADW